MTGRLGGIKSYSKKFPITVLEKDASRKLRLLHGRGKFPRKILFPRSIVPCLAFSLDRADILIFFFFFFQFHSGQVFLERFLVCVYLLEKRVM